MKIKTSNLTGSALDWAVANIIQREEGRIVIIRREDYVGKPIELETANGSYEYEWWAPSRIWSQGGPIIERENIDTRRVWTAQKGWQADNERCKTQYGPTPLVAAMLCFVASKLGEEVEVPDELI